MNQNGCSVFKIRGKACSDLFGGTGGRGLVRLFSLKENRQVLANRDDAQDQRKSLPPPLAKRGGGFYLGDGSCATQYQDVG